MSNNIYILNNKTVLGGGNNLKGLPPSATNFYGLSTRVKTVRIKANIKPFDRIIGNN